GVGGGDGRQGAAGVRRVPPCPRPRTRRRRRVPGHVPGTRPQGADHPPARVGRRLAARRRVSAQPQGPAVGRPPPPPRVPHRQTRPRPLAGANRLARTPGDPRRGTRAPAGEIPNAVCVMCAGGPFQTRSGAAASVAGGGRVEPAGARAQAGAGAAAPARRGVELSAVVWGLGVADQGAQASVPLTLSSDTLQASLEFGAGQGGAAASARAAALARSGLRSMALARLRPAAAVVVLFLVV